MFHWIFLTGLNQALNLFHFIRADVAEDGSQVLLVSADVKQDNITVDDPADIATLQEVFQQNALKRLEPATATLVVTETDNSPLPSAADTAGETSDAATTGQVQATLVTDAPLAGTGKAEQIGSLQEAAGTVELPKDPVKSVPSATQEPAPQKTAVETAAKQEPTAGKTAVELPTKTAATETAEAAEGDKPPAAEQQSAAPAASQDDAKTAAKAQDEPPAKPAPKKSAPFGGSPFGN